MSANGQLNVPSGATFRTIDGGHYNTTCGIQADWTFTCWGDNSSGQATVPAGLP